MKFSPRLAYVVNEVPHDASVIDIAADHGYVALDLMRKNNARKIIVSDIAEQPLQAGKKNFYAHGVNGDFRLGSGLTVLQDDEQIDYGIIAGVGGKLMLQLFEEAPEKMAQVGHFILSANIGMELVRKWMHEHNYAIIQDVVIQDGVYFYETITVTANSDVAMVFPQEEHAQTLAYFFGANMADKMQSPDTKPWLLHLQEKMQEKVAQISKSNSASAQKQLAKYLLLLQTIEEWLVWDGK